MTAVRDGKRTASAVQEVTIEKPESNQEQPKQEPALLPKGKQEVLMLSVSTNEAGKEEQEKKPEREEKQRQVEVLQKEEKKEEKGQQSAKLVE